MQRLPHWVLTDKYPAFFDSESLTSIEQVGRVYGAMQTLIDEYNSFADMVNKNIDDFEIETRTQIENFEKCVTDLVANYIKSVDSAIDIQNTKIQYMEDNLDDVIEELIREERIVIDMNYDQATEELTFTAKAGGEA